MFDGLLKSKFYTKCKSDIKHTRTRIEMIKKKRNAMQKFQRNDVAALLKNGLDMKAYSKVEGLLIEINRSECYDFIDQYCAHVSNYLVSMNKQRDCPEECRESLASLMFAAARFADLPELRELRTVFSEKYGNSLDCFANKELVEKLKSGLPSRDKKLQLLREIAAESGLEWNSKALENKLFNEQANGKDVAKETNNSEGKIKEELIAPLKKKDVTHFEQKEVTKPEDRSLHKKENAPLKIPAVEDIAVDGINRIEKQDQHSFMRNHPKEEERVGKLRKYGLIPPPYAKSEAERTKIDDPHEEKSKPVPKSVRRRHSNPPPPLQETCDNNEKEKIKEANKEQAAQAQRILRFLDKGSNNNEDREEKIVNKLLLHYSRKKGTHERVKSDMILKLPFQRNENLKTGSSNSEKGTNKEGPSRVSSLPSEVSSPSETLKRHFRASSFQPEMLNRNNNHVHPKLPEYDDFMARLAELRRK